jgi:3,4-dihydroxy 2-butanone 4-phosphate synthase/GTP cyclohydrolase II
MSAPFTPIPEAIEAIRAGRTIILVDDENRENEGDFVFAAEHVTPEKVNFMAKEGRGLICLALPPERCDELGLDLMAAKNESAFETAFTVSIEARDGVTTGISAADRARTIAIIFECDFTFIFRLEKLLTYHNTTPSVYAVQHKSCQKAA